MARDRRNEAIRNANEIDGRGAVVSFDREIALFRGEILALSGVGNCYADGVRSLEVYLEACREKGLEPFRAFSGKFSLRPDPKLHELAAIAAAARSKSLNAWEAEAIKAATAG
jgi:predicted HicB family RNase H-like nuclease